MNAGDLDEQVQLEQRVESKGAMAGVKWTWAPFQSAVWAQVKTLSGREVFAGAQLQTKVDRMVRIRYMPGVREKMRVKHVTELDSASPLTRYYDIEAIVPEGRQDGLKLLCVERAADGFQD